VARAGRHAWAEWHYRAAQHALERRAFAEARTHLACCLQVWPTSASVHLLAARAARRAGAYPDAEQHLQRCQELTDTPDGLTREWNLLRAQRGELTPQVEGYLASCLRQDPPDAPLLLEALTQGYRQTCRLGEARACVEQLLERQPDHARALVWYGEILEQFRLPQLALDAYQRAFDLDPEDDWGRLCLAELKLHRHDAAAAAVHFEVLCHRLPGNAAVRLGLARCRRQAGQTDEARQLLDALLVEHPDEGLILSERGRLALNAGELAAAETWLRQAAARLPGDRQAIYALYQCLSQRGRTAEAETYLARAEAIDRDQRRVADLTEQVVKARQAPALRCELGVLCLRLGQEQEGLRWFFSALHDDPAHKPTHQALADYYQRTGQPDRAAYHRRLGG
jgi:tetratricopeptide (TPR) repeat protein